MWKEAMILYYLFILLIALISGCPVKDVPPCSCAKVSPSIRNVRCTKVYDSQSLSESINNMRPINVSKIQIDDSNFLYIPYKLFKGLGLKRLVLFRMSLMSLTDSDEGFVGLEKKLTSLTIRDSTIFNGLEWKILRNLTALQHLMIHNVVIEYIDEDVKDVGGLKLNTLMLDKNRLSHISANAFSSMVYLKHMRISSNLVSNLKRSMFPNPADQLSVINLSYNKIDWLPKDLFTNMSSLHAVYLAGNAISSLDATLFAPVWKNLTILDLSDNSLRCDCRMEWILEREPEMRLDGKCVDPPAIQGKNLTDLEDHDLWCY